jgi:LPXTG-motif cell wall-anchored protein
LGRDSFKTGKYGQGLVAIGTGIVNKASAISPAKVQADTPLSENPEHPPASNDYTWVWFALLGVAAFAGLGIILFNKRRRKSSAEWITVTGRNGGTAIKLTDSEEEDEIEAVQKPVMQARKVRNRAEELGVTEEALRELKQKYDRAYELSQKNPLTDAAERFTPSPAVTPKKRQADETAKEKRQAEERRRKREEEEASERRRRESSYTPSYSSPEPSYSSGRSSSYDSGSSSSYDSGSSDSGSFGGGGDCGGGGGGDSW